MGSARRAAPGPRRGAIEAQTSESAALEEITPLHGRRAAGVAPARAATTADVSSVPATPRRAAAGPAIPVEEILRTAAASVPEPPDSPVRPSFPVVPLPRHAAASDIDSEPESDGARAPRRRGEPSAIQGVGTDRSRADELPSVTPRTRLLGRPEAPRVKLAYQFGVPVVGVAMLFAVQAFTPAPTSASGAAVRSGEALAEVTATGAASPASPIMGAASVKGLAGLNADGSLSMNAPRSQVSASITSRGGGRATLAPLAGPEQLGRGACPVGGTKQADCNKAIAFMVAQMTSQTRAWHNQCLALVGTAYGGIFRYVPRAIDAAMMVKAGGGMHTTNDYRAIPRGSLLWFASSPSQYNQAGHVAIAVGGGMAISNDVLNDDGRVGVVPITFFMSQWGKIFLGYSSPADSSAR